MYSRVQDVTAWTREHHSHYSRNQMHINITQLFQHLQTNLNFTQTIGCIAECNQKMFLL